MRCPVTTERGVGPGPTTSSKQRLRICSEALMSSWILLSNWLHRIDADCNWAYWSYCNRPYPLKIRRRKYERTRSGPALRLAYVDQIAQLQRCSRLNSRSGYWSQQLDFQPHQCSAVATLAVQRPQQARSLIREASFLKRRK